MRKLTAKTTLVAAGGSKNKNDAVANQNPNYLFYNL